MKAHFITSNGLNFAVKIRIWRGNKFDKPQVKAQAENTKKSTGVLEKSRNSERNESLNVDLNYVAKQNTYMYMYYRNSMP